MSEYQYPDKDDKLTAALINNEYDGLSWQKSEEKVICAFCALHLCYNINWAKA